MKPLRTPVIGAAALVSLLAGCTVGPNYKRPTAPTPTAYKETAPPPAIPNGAWKQAQPGALEGLVGLAGTTDTNPKTVEVAKLFAETEGADFQVNNFWTQSYDAVQLLKQAIESAGSTDGTKVNDALQQITDYEAASGYPGFTLSFGKDKHLGADGICGLVLVTWGADNTVTGPWADYTPDCAA